MTEAVATYSAKKTAVEQWEVLHADISLKVVSQTIEKIQYLSWTTPAPPMWMPARSDDLRVDPKQVFHLRIHRTSRTYIKININIKICLSYCIPKYTNHYLHLTLTGAARGFQNYLLFDKPGVMKKKKRKWGSQHKFTKTALTRFLRLINLQKERCDKSGEGELNRGLFNLLTHLHLATLIVYIGNI